ncbi:MAG: sulfatase-like hydrolase/transferase [Maribacter sp.]
MMKFFQLPLFVMLFLFSCKNQDKNPQTTQIKIERPNILVILCDDLGYADVGFNGAQDITTPALDQLANNGTIFTSGYVAHPFCGPSRAGLMTGRYPHKFGSQFNLPMNSGELLGEGIPLEETFISKVLQESGYYTGIVGKWHLGAVPDYHPNKRGFDDFYGFLGGGHSYFPSEFNPQFEEQIQAGNKLINDYLKPLEYNGKEVRETEYITDALSREAVRFVNNASKKDQPFFLYLAYNAPHSPMEAKEEDLNKFMHIKDKKRRTYAAMVYAVDRGINDIVNSLKENKEFDNTLIVFLSDNGGKLKFGSNNAPLSGEKGDTNEGGYRVPMFFHWPKNVPAGKRSDHPVSALDFYPTFAHLGGVEIPATMQLDGKNIWDHLVTGKSTRDGEMIFAMRHREGYTDVGARKDNWKILKTQQNPWKLYDLEKDISETNDLSAQHPQLLKEMVLKAEEWSKTHTEPRWFDPEELSIIWEEKSMSKFEETFKIE